MEQGIEIEARILAVFRRKQNYYKYAKVLQESFFQASATRYIFSFIDQFFSSGKTEVVKLTIPQLRLIALREIKNKEQKRDILSTLKLIREYPTQDDPIIEKTIKDFVKRQLAKTAILKSLEELEKPNPDFSDVRDTIAKALAVSTDDTKNHYTYFEDTLDRLSDDDEKSRTKTMIKKLDEALGGGPGGGDLVIFLAPPERGKTMMLTNIGVAALFQGKVVAYLSGELSDRKIARRFDLRIAGKPLETLKENPSILKEKMKEIRKAGGRLIIKDYSADSPKIEDIRSFIVNFQNRNKVNIDLLIYDYADLIAASGSHKQERFESREVYVNLRRLANEFNIPIVTASQANRKSIGKHVVSMEDFAEDFSKAMTADVVIAICQTPEELEEQLARLYVAKNRITGKHPIFRVNYKPKTMFVGHYHHEA